MRIGCEWYEDCMQSVPICHDFKKEYLSKIAVNEHEISNFAIIDVGARKQVLVMKKNAWTGLSNSAQDHLKGFCQGYVAAKQEA
jgi:hypothetical protein